MRPRLLPELTAHTLPFTWEQRTGRSGRWLHPEDLGQTPNLQLPPLPVVFYWSCSHPSGQPEKQESEHFLYSFRLQNIYPNPFIYFYQVVVPKVYKSYSQLLTIKISTNTFFSIKTVGSSACGFIQSPLPQLPALCHLHSRWCHCLLLLPFLARLMQAEASPITQNHSLFLDVLVGSPSSESIFMNEFLLA